MAIIVQAAVLKVTLLVVLRFVLEGSTRRSTVADVGGHESTGEGWEGWIQRLSRVAVRRLELREEGDQGQISSEIGSRSK